MYNSGSAAALHPTQHIYKVTWKIPLARKPYEFHMMDAHDISFFREHCLCESSPQADVIVDRIVVRVDSAAFQQAHHFHQYTHHIRNSTS